MPTRKAKAPQEPDGVEDYSLSQVAILLGLGRSTVYWAKNRWNKFDGSKGGLKTFKNELGELRVKVEDYERFKSEREAQAAPLDLLTKQTVARLTGRIGGHLRAARHTPEQMAAPLLAGTARSLELEADPDGTLKQGNPKELARRIKHLEQARMAQLTLASVLRRHSHNTPSPQA